MNGDPLFLLTLALRYAHILGAIAMMGGTIFARFALVPVLSEQKDPLKSELHEQVRRRWAKFVHISIALLLISGFANLGLASRYNFGDAGEYKALYNILGGVKFLLALPIFLFASFLTGKSNAARKFQAAGPMWMNVTLALALVMVLMGGFLRFVPRTLKSKAPAATSQVVPAENGPISLENRAS
ncbi:hypothetical protein Psta_2058 [Pirellula staleyi DSM 6068]|uniref:Copper resistance protein D domain-containing protein n=1 Tax=Pirellula staleyi (strain ATCC 27377 / DSM 6068 / ICPB 4128) TaxID=530564 RepID=D2R1L3_PIRSD|nr:hypothetical protein [Pirellula staleyi]ADB16732.1 hypothetical protein Psta_2058 [Pirellula staleyi DSM 6068]